MQRDDDEISERRRIEAEKARTPEYSNYSYGVLRPVGFLAIATLFGVFLLVAGPTVERRLVGLSVTVVGLALAWPAWRWYQSRKHALVDPPHLQNEFPVRRGELLAIAFMFGALGLLSVTTGAAVLGAALVIAAVGVCVYAWWT